MNKKDMKYKLEAWLVKSVFAVMKSVPLDVASFTGGWLARSLGPFFPAHKVAQQNVAMVFPDASEAERRRIVANMWDNLGRVCAELPHLPGDALFARMQVEGREHLPEPEQAVIFFSGHLGNWEMTYPVAFMHGIKTTLVYRHANNPYVDDVISRIRATRSSERFPKGMKSGFKILRAIKKGYSLLMLIDQKMNDGIPVPFFGRDAMTAPAIAEFALRYNLSLIPAKVLRTRGCHFQATIYPPLQFDKTGDETRDVLTVMTEINRMLEEWIRETPGQWFWVHRRWPKEG